jgi:hypothetical protein
MHWEAIALLGVYGTGKPLEAVLLPRYCEVAWTPEVPGYLGIRRLPWWMGPSVATVLTTTGGTIERPIAAAYY